MVGDLLPSEELARRRAFDEVVAALRLALELDGAFGSGQPGEKQARGIGVAAVLEHRTADRAQRRGLDARHRHRRAFLDDADG